MVKRRCIGLERKYYSGKRRYRMLREDLLPTQEEKYEEYIHVTHTHTHAHDTLM